MSRCEVSTWTVGAAGPDFLAGLTSQLVRDEGCWVPLVRCRFTTRGTASPESDLLGANSDRAVDGVSSSSISIPSSFPVPSPELVRDPSVLLLSFGVAMLEALLSFLARPEPSHNLPLTVIPLRPLLPLRMLAPSSMSAMCLASSEEAELPETMREEGR